MLNHQPNPDHLLRLTPSAVQPSIDFRLIFESTPSLYLVLTPDFQIVAVNDAYLQATMTERKNLLGRGIFEVFPDNPADSQATGVSNLRASLERVVRLKVADSMAVQKYDIRRPDSEGGQFEERFWSPVNTPVLGPDLELFYIIHCVEDVTDFIRYKEREAKSQELTERLLTRNDEMEAEIVVRAREIQKANQRLRETNSELSRLHCELEQRVQERTSELALANAALQQENTERCRTEETLRASEERSRLMIEGVKDYAIFMLDRDGRIVTWNIGAERIIGYSAEEVVGRFYSLYFLPEEIEAGKPQRKLQQVAIAGSIDEEGWRVRKDGSRFWSTGVLTALYDEHGEVRGYSKVTRDLTAQHRQDTLLRSVLDNTEDSVICIDQEGIIETVNEAALTAFGYSKSELMGKNIAMLMPEPHHSQHDQYLQNYRRTGIAKLISFGREVDARRKNGSTFPVKLSVTEFEGKVDGRRHFTGVMRNLTEQRKLEAQLQQSQKMEAFGQLAGGVAHDFNNLLTVINGYSEMLCEEFPTNDTKRVRLDEILRAGQRAAALTRQLLAFSRQQILEPNVVNLNSILIDTESLLRRLIGEDIHLTTVMDRELWRVRVDPGQIQQVVMNLAVNARDAMPLGGLLTIETRNVELDETYCRIHPETRPGNYVLLASTDSGSGMSPEVKARIFEPFFTTKGVGKGTGLGLSVVQGIIKQSGGAVEVYSELGTGTTFKIYLPAIQDSVHASPGPGTAKPLRGRETILLVEDEHAVREMTARLLTDHGYRVIQAVSGKNALEIITRTRERVHLLITDVVMPEMGGCKLAETLSASDPTVKVLYMSGYTDDAVVRHGILHQAVAFLQKPFTPVSLTRKVREVLDQE